MLHNAKLQQSPVSLYNLFVKERKIQMEKLRAYLQSIAWQLTTTFNNFTYGIYCRYLLYHSVGIYFTGWFADWNHPSKNRSSVIYFLPECSSVKKDKPQWFYRQTIRAKKIILPTGIYRHCTTSLSVIGNGIWSYSIGAWIQITRHCTASLFESNCNSIGDSICKNLHVIELFGFL